MRQSYNQDAGHLKRQARVEKEGQLWNNQETCNLDKF